MQPYPREVFGVALHGRQRGEVGSAGGWIIDETGRYSAPGERGGGCLVCGTGFASKRAAASVACGSPSITATRPVSSEAGYAEPATEASACSATTRKESDEPSCICSVEAWLAQRERHLQRRKALYRERRAAMRAAAPSRMLGRDSVIKHARSGSATLLAWTIKP